MSEAFRVGLSETLLYAPGTRDRLDGIGVYTLAMHRYLGAQPDVEVVPVVMGRGAFEALPAAAVRYPGPSRMNATLAVLPWNAPIVAQSGARVDVYFATDYRIPRNAALPVCATLHDAIPLSHPQWASPAFRRTKNAVLRSAARHADHIIAISRAMVPELMDQYGIDEAHISVVPNGVDAAWRERDSEARLGEVRRQYGLQAQYFLYVGTLQPRKNVERILAAYDSLPGPTQARFQLVIVGKAGWRTAALVARLRSLAPAGRVRWLDHVPGDDLRPLYQGASAFVFPSLYEGFGLPVLEAFATEVPVLTSNSTALPEVAGDAALLVDPLQVDEIAAAMLRLSEDAALRARLVALGRARASSFTWERCAQRTMEVLRSLR